jgi:hypothetical protein
MKHHRFSRGFSDFYPFHQEEWSGKELASALCDGLVVAEPSNLGSKSHWMPKIAVNE